MSDEQMIYDRCIVRVGQLEAENEQLRRERDFYFQQVTENGERAHGAIDALNAENAKLRELAWRLLEVDRIGATSNEWSEIRELARELGVEV